MDKIVNSWKENAGKILDSVFERLLESTINEEVKNSLLIKLSNFRSRITEEKDVSRIATFPAKAKRLACEVNETIGSFYSGELYKSDSEIISKKFFIKEEPVREEIIDSLKGGVMTLRIGVYVCHCGTNIAGKVAINEVVEFAGKLPDVVIAKDYKFMCSEPGQAIIENDIREQNLNRVVVAACSPLMHENTFRKACERAGLNKFLMQIANIREQCSWVVVDPVAATDKARSQLRGAVNKVRLLELLESKFVPINPATLIVGGGIAGIQSALDIAEAGHKVYLVEKEPSIGGHMSQFDKTFPTLDCAACILTPKMVQVGQHSNIELLAYSEVVQVDGYVGNFKVKVKKKPKYVINETCTGCGNCWACCPSHRTPVKRVMKMGNEKFARKEVLI
jgi:heterodisulfide reductase subunit A-like polyferredoxin